MDEHLYFDKNIPTDVTLRNLPHWSQEERVQFVTFRLSDSMPESVLRYWLQLRKEWFDAHPQPWSEGEQREYYHSIVHNTGKWLDSGHGSCLLKDAVMRCMIQSSLTYYDGKAITIYAYVIMPNHVHLLASPIGNVKIQDVLGKIRRYTSRQINQKLGKSGNIWQREVFDHLVRNEYFFVKYLRYIKENPRFLPDSYFSLYFSKEIIEKYAEDL